MASTSMQGANAPGGSLRPLKVFAAYVSKHAVPLAIVPLLAGLLNHVYGMQQNGELQQLLEYVQKTELHFSLFMVGWVAAGLFALLLVVAMWRKKNIYLVDYTVHKPDDSWAFSRQDAEDFCIVSQRFTEEAVDFQRKVMWFSGLGNETYLPPWCSKFPQTTSMEKARLEFDLVIMTSIEDLLKKTGVKPKEIGVVVVNCSLFTPTPSLSASIMNRFKMGNNVINYNLGGMGCSAGVIAIDLARQMLELKPNTYALVISTENITQNMYNGTQRSMLIPNVIFRVGGAAMLLSNKRKEAFRSKYVLKHVVRTTMAHVDDAYNCVMELEDSQGHRGVKLSKDLMKIAGQSLKSNITSLGPKVLPISEQLLFAANFIGRRVFGMKSLKPYVPDFSLAVDHICIHTGGRGVVDEIEKQLALSPYMTEPSRAALYKYGNVSSSSIWYVLSFIETYRGLKRGDLVWQIGFGSGFKCNSAIWKANKSFQDDHIAWKGFNLPAMYEDLATLQLKLNALLESMGKEQYNRESVTGGHTTGMGRPSSNGGIQK